MNAPVQLSMFESTSPSTSPIGLNVILPSRCGCGSDGAVVGSSRGPHHASLLCECCCGHRGWLPGATHKFLCDVIENFGRPTEPIEIRHTQSPPSGADNPAVATATQLKGNPMKIDQLYPSKFLRAADLNGKPLRVTIAGLKREDIGGEQKVVLSFTDEKSLILNKTNARAIAKTLGDETRDWAGKDIVLVPASVDFRGDMVDAIRVRAAAPRPQQQKPQAPPPADEEYAA